jgi:hypothetical protein
MNNGGREWQARDCIATACTASPYVCLLLTQPSDSYAISWTNQTNAKSN